jgi:hypothetical protein
VHRPLMPMGWRNRPPEMPIDKRDEPLPHRWAPAFRRTD